MPPFLFREPIPPTGKESNSAANDPVFKKLEAVTVDEPQTIEYKDNNPVTNEEFKNFTRSGVVTDERILSMYYKMKNHAALSTQEIDMYPTVSKKIEGMLKKASENDKK